MKKFIKDTRLQCPHCGVKTWMKDYRSFMRDHDRPDGMVCRLAAKEKIGGAK